MKYPLHCALVFLAFLSVTLVVSAQEREKAASECRSDSRLAAVTSRRQITLDEIDKSILKQLQPLKEKIYQLRTQALENLINRTLLEAEAARTKTTMAQVIESLMTVDTGISEERVAEIFLENEVAFSGIGEDEAKARIRLDLDGQGRIAAMRRRIADLRSKTDVRICLQPPEAPKLEIADGGPLRGVRSAPVTIYAYSDFQCPYCRQARATVEKVLAANEGAVRLVFKHLPLPIHARAFPAAQAAYCAHEQGRFWRFHDRLFDSNDLSDEALMRIASDTGLDLETFAACLNSDKSQKAVSKDMQEARKAGFSGTPTFVVNGTVLRGAPGAAEFQRLIDMELRKQREKK